MNWHTMMTGWHPSSYSHYEENACVEVGSTASLAGVRDTKQSGQADSTRPVLVFDRRVFMTFLEHIAAS